jgi:hypothetical protein
MAFSTPASVPAFDDLLWPTLQALKAMGGSGSNDELLAVAGGTDQYDRNKLILLLSRDHGLCGSYS